MIVLKVLGLTVVIVLIVMVAVAVIDHFNPTTYDE